MAKPKAVLDTGSIEQVEIQRLGVSSFNVRKNAEVGPDDELVASIRAHGLLQPLIGYIAKSGPATILVCAGQRRLLALGHIAKPADKIPVRIVDEETAIEISLAENLERKDMNPADEVLAFKALLDTGHYDDARISSRFGFTLQHVRRRLKMANLLPEILEALHDGKLSLDAATAYASASHEVQAEIFKKHSAKGAWKPHEPSQVRQDVSLYGIAVNSRIGKFIGGLEPYLAAGGTTLDPDFGDMFTDGQPDARLRDVTVVRKLVADKQAELAETALELAKKAYPFIAGVEWMDVFGMTWGSTMPKLAKGSPLLAIDGSYQRTETAEKAWTAAEEHKGQVFALADINSSGEIEIAEGKFLVDKTAWAKAQPAEQAQQERRQETEEERASRLRTQEIAAIQVNLYARSLIGETPGFGVTSVRIDHEDRMQVTLTRLTPGCADIEGQDHWNRRVKPELLAPFLEQATVKHDEIQAERLRAKEAEAAAREGFGDALAKLEKLPIAEWPAVVVLALQEVDNCDLTISRVEINGNPALWLLDETSEGWSSDDAAQTIEVIRDQSEGWEPTLTTFDTVEAYAETSAGRCRLCGCVEECACTNSAADPDWAGPCGWADATKVLCTNPDCLTKAGVERVKELEPAE